MKIKIKLLMFIVTALLILFSSYTLVYGYDKEEYGDWEDEIEKSGNFEYIVFDNEVIIIGYTDKNKKDIVIPDKIKNLPVVEIGTKAFYNHKNLVNVTIPNTVKYIYDYAFFGCENLNKVTMSSNIKYIWEGAFMNCSNLIEIILPNGLLSFESNTFNNSITIKGYKNSSVWELADMYGFNFVDLGTKKSGDFEYYLEGNQAVISKCYTAKDNITIPNTIDGYNVKGIGYQVIDYSEVKSIIISKGITQIEHDAFAYNFNLKSIVIPDTITKIGENAFMDCTDLIEITIPNKVTEISEYMFYRCENLKKVTLPDTITKIGSSAFAECISLTDINIPKGVVYLDSFVFDNCTSLKNITLPDGLKSLGWSIFSECKNLESVKIPEGITEIGEEMFKNCKNLKRVDIPNTVVDIYDDAFKGANNVTIYGYSGSEAERFAKEKNIKFVSVGKLAVKGDLNENGKIEANDAFLALQLSVSGKTPTAKQLQLGDIDGNGKVDAFDAYQILSYSVGIKDAKYWK